MSLHYVLSYPDGYTETYFGLKKYLYRNKIRKG